MMPNKQTPTSSSSSPTTRPTTSKRATLTNWDGHFAIENAAALAKLCCAVERSCCHKPLKAQNYNGYAATGTTTTTAMTTRRSCSLPCASYSNSSDTDTDDDDNVTDNRLKLQRDALINLGSSIVAAKRNNADDAAGHSRLAHLTRQATIVGSSLIGDSMTEIVIDDLHNAEDEPTSAILSYCKKQFLQPYVVILSLIGINPITTDTGACRACCNYLQVLIYLGILGIGYTLQYFCCYRVDRGFAQPLQSDTEVELSEHARLVRTLGELVFAYIIPSALHVVGYISAVVVCKILDHEQLLNLIERVFLMSMKPRRLCCMLWALLTLALMVCGLWCVYIVGTVLGQANILENQHVKVKVSQWQMLSKIVLALTLLLQQLVQVIIICGYCIECYLLRVHLMTLSYKLLMHTIDYLDWMREMLEFHKLLERLNDRVAKPVCFFIVLNLSAAFSALIYLFKDFNFQYSNAFVIIANLGNICLLLLLGLLPFFMAAALTHTCQRAQSNGHQIRVRPFVYHNSSVDDLNSTLLFASSLQMSAKLFCMPIQSNYLCFAILFLSMAIIVLGMCFNLTALSGF